MRELARQAHRAIRSRDVRGCRFACATKLQYDTKDVLAQPGAKLGKLTQCPVSGVVFSVDGNRPRIRVAGDEFVTCCERCAAKLKKHARRYLKV